MNKKRQVDQHKIGILLSLLLDYADEYKEVSIICEKVINDLYSEVPQLARTTYFQKVSSLIEEKVSDDLLMLGLLAIKSLVQVGANGKTALKLIKELEIMCNSQKQVYEMHHLDKCWNKLNTVMRKNYEEIQRKT
jgi:hypothetical protein